MRNMVKLLLMIAIVVLLIPVQAAFAETNEDYLNNLIGAKQQYNTMLSPAYIRSNTTEDYINPQSGELSLTQTDYVLPGRNGLDLEIKRMYKSGLNNIHEAKVKYINGTWVDYIESDDDMTSFYEDRYNLGIGWRFSFPTIEIKQNSGSSNSSISGTTVENYSLSSPNPYQNCYFRNWTVSKPGASYIRVHFSYIYTEANYDFVKTSAGDKLSGSHSEVWSNWACGSDMDIILDTDSSNNNSGFRIDKIEYITRDLTDAEVFQVTNGYKYLHTETGDIYRIDEPSSSNGNVYGTLENHPVKDIAVNVSNAFDNGQEKSQYVLLEKSGKKTYFSTDGRILGC